MRLICPALAPPMAIPAPGQVILDVDEKIGHTGVAARGENVDDGIRRVVQVMELIGIVPEDEEIGRRRLHGRQTPDGFIGIAHTGWVAVQRHTPHALDGRILRRQALHLVHVGAVG